MAGNDYTPSAALVLTAPPASDGNLLFAPDGGCQSYSANANLVFDAARVGNGHLLFGCESGGDAVDAPLEMTVSATLPALTMVATLAPQVFLQLAAQLPAPTLHAVAQYTSNTARPTVGNSTTVWQSAQQAQTGSTLAQQGAKAAPVSFGASHQNATPAPAGFWHGLPPIFAAQWAMRMGLWQSASPSHGASLFDHQDAARTPLQLQWPWQAATRAQVQTRFGHQDGSRLCRSQRRSLWQIAQRRHRGQWGGFGVGAATALLWLAPWGAGRAPSPGKSPLPPKPPKPRCYIPSAALIFTDAPAVGFDLLFSCGATPTPPAAVVVAIKGFYMTTHSIQIYRADTGAAIHATDFSMSLDAQSWTWRWSANITEHSAAQLGNAAGGAPPELVVLVNGQDYKLLLEQRQRNRQFVPTTWSISGRGLAALLDAPYAAEQSFAAPSAINAQQLAEQILTVNGVGMGWVIDWQLTDWLVPAGAWSLQGSYMAALNDIAAAVGGYVQPHNSERVLRLLPSYPAAPWNWAALTPAIELPDSVVQVEGSEFLSKPAYTRVMVGGSTAGVFGPFTRAGTAGLLLAPQATHPLIGDAAAHRQRGLAILSDTGHQEHLTLSLPLLAETGLIKPGQLLRYNASGTNTTSAARSVLGIVRSTSLRWAESGASQTIGLEVHHDA